MDAEGVEGLPLRLLVAAIVAGLTIPTVVAGLTAYEAQQVELRTVQELDAVVRVAQQLYMSGDGAQDVRVDLAGGVTVRVEYAAIGDAPGGPLAPSVRFKLSGQPEVFLLADPPVPMAGEDGPLSLGPGRHVVRVEYGGVGPVRVVLR